MERTMNFRTASLTLFPATSLILLVACGGGGDKPAPVPVVAVSVSPTTASFVVGGATQTQTFTATVTGNANTSVTWSVTEGAAGGSITTGGVYTAPATPGTYHVVATSVADATKSAMATVTVTPAPAAALVYTNPTTGTYRLVKNDGLSTATHLVLDVTGVGAPSGAGIAFTYTVDTTRATWAKVTGTDAEYIQAGDVFTLGSVPIGIKGKVATTTLTGGLGQKGIVSPAPVALTGVMARVALDLKSGAPVGAATLTSPKAQIIAADGTITTVTVVPGTLSAQ